MAKYPLKQRIRYYFENTMSRGPMGVIKWLAILSFFVVVILGIVIAIAGIKGTPDDQQGLGFVEGAWQILMSTLDQGAMAGDVGWAFRAVRFVATLGSLFLLSILIGTISSGIDAKLGELKKGKSKVLESNHTLILGWSEKIFSILTEVIEANSNQKRPSIVILANRDKVEMDDEIRQRIPNLKNTRIIVRSGSPLSSNAIEVVSPNEARSIIVLAGEEENTDTYVIKSVLAITNGKNRKKDAYHIVAELKDPKNMEAAELVGNDETIFVLSSDLISRITAQTCRQSGLSVVYSDLLQFEGDEIYFQDEPKLIGKTYKESILMYETSAVLGVFTKDENVLMNPAMDYVYQQGDQVIAISEDDDTVVLSGKTDYKISVDSFQRQAPSEPEIERTLILGWNQKGKRIIEELDNYVAKGSEVLIVSEGVDFADDLKDLQENLSRQSIRHIEGDINDSKTLIDLKTETYNHIILLSYTHIDIQESDAKTLICLLHLRNLSEQANKDYAIVSEMLDIQNRELGVVAKADDFIVSDNLISLMLSQLSENKELKKVYDVLFEAEGSEIYLKPVNRYIKPGISVNFYTVAASCTELNETVIGYRITAEAQSSEHNFGVHMNPDKSKSVTFTVDDYIIVLAED
ncbi:MAG: NAD-binding protein [Crocinitomicaceae bacterium]|nr:NAD-binding protein [Crocinitomicaceae bacterium]MBK8924449.1 NAD-binding protein [Crocinitomicaceae bacterium]